MDFSKLRFDINDLIKICGFIVGLVIFRNDVVSEIRSNKVFDTADKQVINYRLSDLEKCCAIKPRELAVETYRVN